MTLKEMRHKGTFNATNGSGYRRMLHVYVEVHDATSFADPNAEREGLMRIETEDGLAVNRIRKGSTKSSLKAKGSSPTILGPSNSTLLSELQ